MLPANHSTFSCANCTRDLNLSIIGTSGNSKLCAGKFHGGKAMKREMFWPLSALVLAFSLSGEWYLIADTLRGLVCQL